MLYVKHTSSFVLVLDVGGVCDRPTTTYGRGGGAGARKDAVVCGAWRERSHRSAGVVLRWASRGVPW